MDLPQKSTKKCKNLRERELTRQRGIYQLAISPYLQIPLVNMTINQLAEHHKKDEFAKEHFVNYYRMLLKTRELGKDWIAQHPEEITDFQEYENIFKEFRSSMENMATVSYFNK